MNFIMFSDIHWVGSNSYRVDDIMNTLDNKFTQIKAYIDEFDVKACFISGDLFDQKHGLRIPYELTARAINQIKSLGIPTYGITGNHEMNLGSYSKHPINIMYETGVLIKATCVPQEIANTGVYICGFDHKYIKDTEQFNIQFDKDSPLIGLIHLVMNREPGMFYSEPQYGIEEIGGPIDLYCCGHIHTSLPIMQNSRDQLYAQPGALRRTNTASEEIDRIPQVALIQVNTDLPKRKSISVRYLPIECRKDIFKDWKKHVESEKKAELDQFMEKVKLIRYNNKVDIDTLIRESDLDPETRVILESYLND